MRTTLSPMLRRPLGRPSTLVLDWRLEDALDPALSLNALTGQAATFARASIATGIDASGKVFRVADHQFRTIYSRSKPWLLVEPSRTNAWTKSENGNHADWVKNNANTGFSTQSYLGPDGAYSAGALTELAAGPQEYYISQALPTLTDSTAQTITVFVKKFYQATQARDWCYVRTTNKANRIDTTWFNVATGNFGTTDANHTVRKEAFADGWYRLTIILDSSQTGGTTPTVHFGMSNADNVTSYTGFTGGAQFFVHFWGMQFEKDTAVPTSYIPTDAATVTRSADVLSWALNWVPPQSHSMYVDCLDLGGTTLNGCLCSLGATADNNPKSLIYSTANAWKGEFMNGANSTVGVAPAGTIVYGDQLEALFSVTSGAVGQMSWAINGGADTLGAAGSAATSGFYNQTAWGAAVCRVNEYNGATGRGCMAVRAFKIGAGVYTLDALRKAY